MKNKLIASYSAFCSPRYISFFMLYFFFFLANTPLESAIPYLFEEANMSAGIYGAFQSAVALLFIFITPIISFFTVHGKYYCIGFFALGSSFVFAMTLLKVNVSAMLIVCACFFLLLGRKLFNFSVSSKINYQVDSGLRGKYFAVRDLFLFAGSSLGLIFFGLIQKRKGLSQGYGILSIFFIVAVFILFYLKKKNYIIDTLSLSQKRQNKASLRSIFMLFKNRYFFVFAFSGVLMLFYQTTLIYLPVLGSQFGVSISSFLYLSGVFTIINAILSIFMSYTFDGKSKKAVFIVDIAVDMIPALLFLFGNSRGFFFAAYFVIMLKDFFAPISYAYKHDCFTEEEGIMALGVLASIDNAFSIIYPVVIGLLWNQNYKLVYLFSFVTIFISMLLCCIGLPNKAANDGELQYRPMG